MIVSCNFYYARPGNAAAVLRQRLRASDVRAQLGLPRGRTISKLEGNDNWPDTAWRLDFADMAAQDADMAVRAASADFEAIRLGMRQLYRRFERPLYAPCAGDSGLSCGTLHARLLLHGIHCTEAARPAVRKILGDAATGGVIEYLSGANQVPQFLCETGSAAAGLPAAALIAAGARLENSAWQIEDCG